MREIKDADEALRIQKELEDAWRDPELPKRQRELVESELGDFFNGKLARPHPYIAMIDLLGKIPDLVQKSVVEIGCASGYYTPILAATGVSSNKYIGCDYSSALVKMAQEKYPGWLFGVEDARALDFPDRFVDLVIESCVIIHVAEWDLVLKEAIRVSNEYVLLHRTPFSVDGEPHLYVKEAYGVKMFERHYPEQFLKAWMEKKSLTLIAEESLQKSDTYHYKSMLWRKQ